MGWDAFLQALLEQHLEQLHELLEPVYIRGVLEGTRDDRRLFEERFNTWRIQATNLVASTDGFITKLLDAVDDGFITEGILLSAAAKPAPPPAASAGAILTPVTRAKRLRSEKSKVGRDSTSAIVIDDDDDIEDPDRRPHTRLRPRSSGQPQQPQSPPPQQLLRRSPRHR